MKKMLKRTTAIFLAAVMILSSFAVMSFAVDTDEVATVLQPGTVPVTINPKTDSALFVFTPTQTSYYYFSTNCTDYVWFDIQADSDDFFKYGSCDLIVYLHENEKYIVSIYSEESKSFDMTLKNIGRITDVKIVNDPYQKYYIDGYDIRKDSNWLSPAGFINLDGLEMNITFSDGTYMIEYVDDYEIDYDLFDIGLDDDYVIGKNEVTLTSSCTEASVSFDIYIIANPIKSIEISKMPDKTDYVVGLDGEFKLDVSFNPTDVNVLFLYDFCYDGLEVKINFTDGTSKTAVYSNGDFYIDGEEASYYCEEYDTYFYMESLWISDINPNFTASFLGHEAYGKFNILPPTGFAIIKVLRVAINFLVDAVFEILPLYIREYF